MKNLMCAIMCVFVSTLVVIQSASAGELYSKAYDFYKNGEFEKAEKLIYKNDQNLDDVAKMHNLNGLIKLNQKNYLFAKKAFSKAIESDPSMAAPYVHRGDIHMMYMETELALDDYNKAIKNGYREYDIYLKKAKALSQMNKNDEALDNADISINKEKTADALALRANIKIDKYSSYRDEKLFQSALDDINSAIQMDRNNYYFYYNKSMIYLAAGKEKEALDALKNSIGKNPQFAKGYIDMGKINKANGNNLKACEYFNKALALGDKRAKYLIESNCNK